MARYRILSWGEIPAQIKVFEEGRRPVSIELAEWFAQEIDRVAMRDGVIGGDEYLERWSWSADAERPGPPRRSPPSSCARSRQSGSLSGGASRRSPTHRNRGSQGNDHDECS